MLRTDLANLVSDAVDGLIRDGVLPEEARIPIEIADTKTPEHGDFACNYALVATKRAGKPPRVIAEALRERLLGSSIIEAVEVAGPGFLNLRLYPSAISGYLSSVVWAGTDFGKVANPNPLRLNVEFVSVNPNGPITVGSARGAAFGDTLCRVFAAAGNVVHREYYINDGVNSEQMRQFALSVQSYAQGLPFPEKGYRGDYVQDVAANIGDVPADASVAWFQSRSQDLMLLRQREALTAFRVTFDTWFSEQALHDAGDVSRCIDELTSKGVADAEPYRTVVKFAKGGVVDSVTREPQTGAEAEDDDLTVEANAPHPQPLPLADEGKGLSEPSPSGGGQGEGENAQPDTTSTANLQADTLTPTPLPEGERLRTLWLRSTKFGDDMDRVLRRRDGRLTYIASDVAYHKDKFNRPPNAQKLITILGPDHHGYIGRLHAVLAALLRDGVDTDENNRAALEEARTKLEVLIFQIVRFVKEGKPAPMRKRDGNIYALIDLIEEIGANLAPEADKAEQKEVGADVARFFYLMRSHDTHMDFDIDLATKQSDENPVFYVQYAHARICSVIDKSGAVEKGDGKLLTHPRELALIKKILDLPHEVARCAADYGVHRLATYAVELARTYHHFYDACRVIQPEEPELTADRLLLCDAARIALSQVCGLLGVRAPRRLERASLPA